MDNWTKVKEWVNENAPMLANVYQNKYVGMGYDHFASLRPKQQKQVILGVFCGILAIVVGFLLISYLSLWSYSSKANKAYSMINLLQQYQKQRRDKSSQIQHLERNTQLAAPGELKRYLTDQARAAQISPRMIQVDEKGESGEGGEDGKSAHEVKAKQATVILDRINLTQLKGFLSNVEFGQFNLGISSIKITNDNKLRGYMKVELGIVAYLFQSEEGA